MAHSDYIEDATRVLLNDVTYAVFIPQILTSLTPILIVTRAEDVLPNINCMQTAISVHCCHPATTPAATQWYHLLLCAVYGLRRTPYYALSMGTTQQFFVFFVPGNLDL